MIQKKLVLVSFIIIYLRVLVYTLTGQPGFGIPGPPGLPGLSGKLIKHTRSVRIKRMCSSTFIFPSLPFTVIKCTYNPRKLKAKVIS